MKRLVVGGTVAALLAGGAGAALADGGSGPSQNGSNNYGLCVAYVAQSDHNPNGPSAPFQRLQENSQQSASDFYNSCAQMISDSAPGNSNGTHGGH